MEIEASTKQQSPEDSPIRTPDSDVSMGTSDSLNMDVHMHSPDRVPEGLRPSIVNLRVRPAQNL